MNVGRVARLAQGDVRYMPSRGDIWTGRISPRVVVDVLLVDSDNVFFVRKSSEPVREVSVLHVDSFNALFEPRATLVGKAMRALSYVFGGE